MKMLAKRLRRLEVGVRLREMIRDSHPSTCFGTGYVGERHRRPAGRMRN